ncbi:MAG: DUF108 domain-containing protein [Candidatus Omnitrophica bacterium]|nr:DUF108 domain-containing protein [Candidatus Omnitrophota bacterium]MBU2043846.1 DUF108 domain-containing protein [Candidatus Omnitrophota bacterium]MBU2265544.1 DUF108 domain-containing protein [Candidatus Omnitrophota bacterium]MBU2473813.1 DUF108 domain-containing protein [Candidatus Omnitrophota bacterium]
MLTKEKVKIGIIGCGSIGEGVAIFIDQELASQAKVTALADLDSAKALNLQKKLKAKPQILDNQSLIKTADLVIESASAKAAEFILEKAIQYKKEVIILSVGVFINRPDLLKQVKTAETNVYVPSGAIAGVDGLGALGLAGIKKVTITTSKPPKGLIGADYLKQHNIDLENLDKPVEIFEGNVSQAVKYFPKNINVSATILIASGFQDVRVAIMADPSLKRNVHAIRLESEQGNLDLRIENTPSKLNPKTSALAILSTQYLLKKILSPFKIGS